MRTGHYRSLRRTMGTELWPLIRQALDAGFTIRYKRHPTLVSPKGAQIPMSASGAHGGHRAFVILRKRLYDLGVPVMD